MFTSDMILGAKLAAGLGLTIVGMGVVFAALIAISLALDALRFMSRVLEKNKPGLPAAKADSRELRSKKPVGSIETEVERVAVLTAAVAAALEKNPDRFVITAIRPRTRPDSLWSLAGRQQQMKERPFIFSKKGRQE